MNYYNYFTEIEETFVRRRGKNLLLSPLDWALIESWQERELPLHVVLRGIERVFDGADREPARRRSVKSLMYCKEEIEAQYAVWLESQTGKTAASNTGGSNGLLSRQSVTEHIESAIAALKNSKSKHLGEDFEQAAGRLKELKQNLSDDFESVEQTLTDIENLLDRALLTSTDRAHLNALEKETAAQMAAYKGKMEAETFQKTFDLMLLKRLRDEAEIPRLSLFYL